ncbi:MAG: hypothetical protein ACR2OO_10145 [Thermomicrobiales bacterium]
MNANHDLKALNTNQFVGATKRTPRPTGPADGVFGATGRAALARDQADYDAAKRWDDENIALRAARLAALDAKRDAERDARRQAADGRFVDHLREGYFSADPLATEAEFLADLPRIRRDLRVQAATADPAAPPIDRRLYGI